MGFFSYSEEVKKYEINGEKVFFISDWNSESDIMRPIDLINNALDNTKKDADTYFFTENEIGQKKIANCAIQSNISNILPQNILIGNNATSLLSMVIFTFNRINKKKVVFITPTYFSIIEVCSQLDFNIFEYQATFPNFTIDYEDLEHHIVESSCDWILLTDPFFGSGVSLCKFDYQMLCNIARKYQLYLVVDFARGGAKWSEDTNCIIPPQWASIRSYDKGLLIDSLSKRLFVNGIKVSVLIGDENIISECKEYSDSFFGSISAPQINMLKMFYDIKYFSQLNEYVLQNIRKAKYNYELLVSIMLESNIKITKPTDGNYVILGLPRIWFIKNDDWNIFSYILDKYRIYTLPMSLYNYECKEFYLFRINLLLSTNSLMNSIMNLLEFEEKFYDNI